MAGAPNVMLMVCLVCPKVNTVVGMGIGNMAGTPKVMLKVWGRVFRLIGFYANIIT